MLYIKLENNKIVLQCETENEELIASLEQQGFVATEREVVGTHYNGLMFADEVDQQAEEQAIAEIEARQEEEKLKPTVDDLTEALAILTDIVLGGAE